MHDCVIERLGPEEWERAAANCALFWAMAGRSTALQAFLRSAANILVVAEVDGAPAGQVIGYVLARWDRPAPMLFLYSIDVAEEYRRQGIARRMIETFRAVGRGCGCTDGFVFTNAANTPAMQLYAALGAMRPNRDDVLFDWVEDDASMAADADGDCHKPSPRPGADAAI